jgi:hypothetical protein
MNSCAEVRKRKGNESQAWMWGPWLLWGALALQEQRNPTRQRPCLGRHVGQRTTHDCKKSYNTTLLQSKHTTITFFYGLINEYMQLGLGVRRGLSESTVGSAVGGDSSRKVVATGGRERTITHESMRITKVWESGLMPDTIMSSMSLKARVSCPDWPAHWIKADQRCLSAFRPSFCRVS